MSEAIAPAAPEAAPHKVRPFYWSVRRELWENRSVYLAPLAVAAVVLLGFGFHFRGIANDVRLAGTPLVGAAHTAANARVMAATGNLVAPFAISAAILVLTGVLVGVFYALGSLHGERRDRTVLFWKSLPVSDLTSVLAKAFVPVIAIPVAVIATIVVTQVIMLGMAVAAMAMGGVDASVFWSHVQPTQLWTIAAYGLAAMVLWGAPVLGWLFVVSAWAKRMTIVWAIALPAAVCIFERLAFGTQYAWDLVKDRLEGGTSEAFAQTGAHTHSFGPELMRPLEFLANPGLWIGLVIFAACLAACVWLRRRSDPI